MGQNKLQNRPIFKLFCSRYILETPRALPQNPPPCSSPYWLPNTETIVLSTNQNYRLNMSLVTAYRHDRQFALNFGLESSLRVWKQLKHEPKLQEKVYSSLCWVIFLTWRNRIWWEFFLIRLQTRKTCTFMHCIMTEKPNSCRNLKKFFQFFIGKIDWNWEKVAKFSREN